MTEVHIPSFGLEDGKIKPRLNFITLHYMYIIGMAILGSILIYPVKNIAYIDSLFFASGAATQAGLNPVDVNNIALYQQIVTYLIAMVANPIFINTGVVFIRLHWFEKRFQHIVTMSRQPSKARTLSKLSLERGGLDREERGVRGREIKVLHPDSRTSTNSKFHLVQTPEGMMMKRKDSDSASKHSSVPEESQEIQMNNLDGSRSRSVSPGSSSTAAELPKPPPTSNSNAGVQFVNLPTPNKDGVVDREPSPHIAFANGQKGRALRIPGPREFEQGGRAHEVDDDDAYTLNQVRTSDAGPHDGSPAGRSFSMSQAATNASNALRMRKLPSVDRVLPHVATMASAAFSVGPARRRSGVLASRTETKDLDMPYLSYKPTLGRNSQFVDLTDEQRDELGGIEYRSLKLLAKILIAYFVLWHLFGVLSLLPWIYDAPSFKAYVESCGVNPVWWALYTAQTAFNDLGFTLTPDSMMSFQKATWVLLVMSYLIVIGNTGFPCLLRFIVWIMFKLVPKDSSVRECLNFLLDHPRRCFTLLFPSQETWVLFGILIGLNVLDVILFIALDIHDDTVSEIPVGSRVMVAIFQAVSTRTAGTSAVNLAQLHPAVQVSYMIMMYISVFPIAISVRRTNVYEERSLGVFEAEDETQNSPQSFVGTHLRKQLSFDLWYIFLGLFIISIVEGARLQNTNEYAFTIFSVLFEVVSAYGTVGLSLGYPTINASFSAEFHAVSKLVIIAMQIRGRHRGLPYELDRAVLLPRDKRDSEMVPTPRRDSTMTTAHLSNPPSMGRPYSQRVPSQAIEDD